ncbi:probable mitochondrial glutathione transporter SLC25A40 [Drosophila gunungcola]|uniref:probable mitochondrial glutathione transporter SLC25A40 n=1 Tax=Drosophila gunungcola TaxID=103775 RepID=UPI0022E00A1C|nr:probable mitochondrial glutathione transporter SLC25A40 [Drosophila gunungcola]
MSKEDSGASSAEASPAESEIAMGRGPRLTPQRRRSLGGGECGGTGGSGVGSSAAGDRSAREATEPHLAHRKVLSDPRFRIRPLQQVISACAGAMITACFMTPLDVIKTRMQSQQSPAHKCFFYSNGLMDHLFSSGQRGPAEGSRRPRPQFSSTWDALMKISRYEGLGALWSGLGPTLVSALPSTIIYFVAYEQFKAKYLQMYERHLNRSPESRQLDLRDTKMSLPLVIPMMSGVTARICAVTGVSPIELVRTKMQAQRQTYAQMLQFVRNVVALQGVWGLWRGLRPTILRDVPFSGIYWPIYEYLKQQLGQRSQPSFSLSFLAGVLAGSVAALVTTPFDVVKTHEQIEFGERVIFTDSPARDFGKKSTYSRLTAIYRVHGVRGLFAGCGPRLLKVAPACAIMISTFEYSKSFFFYYNVRHHNEALLLTNPNATLVDEDDIE